MKLFILTLLLFASFSSVRSQTFTSSCTPSGNMTAIYWNDAYLLATQRVDAIQSHWKDSVIIPGEYIDSIEKAFYAMENMQDARIKDTILSLFGYSNFNFGSFDSLHTGAFYSLKSIRMIIANDMDWAMDWASGNYYNTANAFVNYLAVKYNLAPYPDNLQLYSDKKIYNIGLPVAANTPSLVKQFELVPGVVDVYSRPNIFANKYISANILNGDIFLEYNYGCGDCPSGCTFGRIWNFRINTSTDCSVDYISEVNWGNPLQWMSGVGCFDAIVPLGFTNIKAIQKDSYRQVEWQVAMENYVLKYIVERSIDGIHFTPVTEIKAKKNDAGTVNYSWADNENLTGDIFYRIKMINQSEAVKYSAVTKLSIRVNAFASIYPTILKNDKLIIHFNNAPKDQYRIYLINSTGQKLYSTEIRTSVQTYSQQLQIPGRLTAGMYIVSLRSNTKQFNQMIVVQ